MPFPFVIDENSVVAKKAHGDSHIDIHENEFWTARQRQGHSLHEISYRACYKPQLPRFFIEQLTAENAVVYDPFMGRGTTLIEAHFLNRRAVGNDINPLSLRLAAPRLNPPPLNEIAARLAEINFYPSSFILHPFESELLTFFHPQTLDEILAWRDYFARRRAAGEFDKTDAWLEMTAANRLTGHSPGFFSVYTLPPNQAVSVAAQKRINARRKQQPEYRDTKALILKKSRQLLRDALPENYGAQAAVLHNASADATHEIPADTIDLVVTSPPFLDVVNYEQDNWLRMWFCNVRLEEKSLWQLRNLDEWLMKMQATLTELRRVLKSGGYIAFEVGEVRNNSLQLENEIARLGINAELEIVCILINAQNFTKTANCWGVANNTRGTNTNRIVVMRKI